MRQGFVLQQVAMFFAVTSQCLCLTYASDRCCINWMKQKGKCYRAFESALTWKQAAKTCDRESSQLVTLYDITVQTFVLQMRPQYSDLDYWIGYYRNGTTWQWTDTLNNVSINFLQRSNLSDSGACAAITKKGVWLPKPCSNKLPYLCQTDTFDYKLLLLPWFIVALLFIFARNLK